MRERSDQLRHAEKKLAAFEADFASNKSKQFKSSIHCGSETW